MFRLRTLCLIYIAAAAAAAWPLCADEPTATPEIKEEIAAVETNEATRVESSVDTQELLRSVVILQEQLRATREQVERARAEAETSARHGERLMTDRLNFIEQKQVEMLQSSNRLTLIVVGGIAVVACLAVILGGWLQMRAVTKLTEISLQLQMLPALAAPAARRELPSGTHTELPTDVEEHAAILNEKVARLQTKVEELEHGGKSTNGGHNGGGTAATQIAKGQTFLSINKPAEALECFESAIAADSRNTDAWIKKGSALERLQRVNDAIAAYDHAIQLDEQIATAHLFKAGVFNRQKRYAEALQCYEKALSVQKSRAQA